MPVEPAIALSIAVIVSGDNERRSGERSISRREGKVSSYITHISSSVTGAAARMEET